MDFNRVFAVTWAYEEKIPEDTEDEQLKHVRWMLDKIRLFMIEHDVEKAMRWIGFVQGVFWVKGIFTIDEMREHNRLGKAKQEKQHGEKG